MEFIKQFLENLKTPEIFSAIASGILIAYILLNILLSLGKYKKLKKVHSESMATALLFVSVMFLVLQGFYLTALAFVFVVAIIIFLVKKGFLSFIKNDRL